MIIEKKGIRFSVAGDGRVVASPVDDDSIKCKGRVAGEIGYLIVYPRIEFSVNPPAWITNKSDRKGWSVDDYETDEEIERRPLDWCSFDILPEEVTSLKTFFEEAKKAPKPEQWVDAWGRKVVRYNGGHITEYADGYGCSYECIEIGRPYQALTNIGHTHVQDINLCKQAIDAANLAQGVRLSPYSALSYREAKEQGIGATWRKPNFGVGDDVVMKVIAARAHYILSEYNGLVYLSMSEAHCEYVCRLGEESRFISKFEKPVDTQEPNCHYCGLPANKTNIFGVWTCDNCG